MDRREFLKSATMSALMSTTGAGIAQAQAYPSKPISLIVPYPPGGVADTRARFQAEYLGSKLGQPGVVDNVPGAGGIQAVRRLIAAKPDGYTLLSATSSTMIVVPLLNKSATYDPLKDLTPICQMFIEAAAISVAQDSKFKTLQDVIDEAKRRPGELTYASPGVNSLYHLCGEAFQQLAGIKMKHVPYSGAAQYTLDMIAGRIDLAASTLGTYMNNRDKLRVLAVAMPERAKHVPDAPTFAEAGIKGLDLPAGSGIFAPANTPADVRGKIADVYGKMLADPAVAERLTRLGLEGFFRSPQEFEADLAKQYASVRDLIKLSGLKPPG